MNRVLARGGWLCVAEPDADGSRLARATHAALRVLRPLVRRIGGRRSPAASDERPLAPESVLEVLRQGGYASEPAYVVHPPYLYRFLPPGLALRVAALLNRGDVGRRRPADLLVVRARKPIGDGASPGFSG